MKLKELIKSYSFWTALSGAVIVLLQSLGRAFGFSVKNELVSDIIMAIAGVLVVCGVVTLPIKDEDSSGDDDLDSDSEDKDQNDSDKEGE